MLLFSGRTFNYFGSSNSQLRDNGCYFINGMLSLAHFICQLTTNSIFLILADVKNIDEIRRQLGSFKIQSAPKMMSRLGQCFTQARVGAIFHIYMW
jgi:hypothetical protein